MRTAADVETGGAPMEGRRPRDEIFLIAAPAGEGAKTEKVRVAQGFADFSHFFEKSMAERVGFEPTYRGLAGNSISSRARYGQLRYLSARSNRELV